MWNFCFWKKFASELCWFHWLFWFLWSTVGFLLNSSLPTTREGLWSLCHTWHAAGLSNFAEQWSGSLTFSSLPRKEEGLVCRAAGRIWVAYKGICPHHWNYWICGVSEKLERNVIKIFHFTLLQDEKKIYAFLFSMEQNCKIRMARKGKDCKSHDLKFCA